MGGTLAIKGNRTMTTRVLIVDDHPAVRDGLAVRISSEDDLEVCGEAADVAEALKLMDSTRPDVAVIDIQLKDSDGLGLVKRLRAHNEAVRILVWSVYPDKLYAERALNAGALGYINKEHPTGRIVEAIRRVRDGKVYLSDEMAECLLSQTVGGNRSLRESPIESLSDRELEVFRLIGEGATAAQLAQRLHLSRHTVDTHRQRIKQKLNLSTAEEVTRAAIRWELEREKPGDAP
jgi:DNA-binding NarL/FixJ family response regulator